MKLKYLAEHQHCQPCPPTGALETQHSQTAFRLVAADPITDADFLPPAILSPHRTFSARQQKCSAYALSFFKTQKQARALYLKLSKQNKNFRWKYIAKTQIDPGDGLVTNANNNGHFDLHEAQGIQLHTKATCCGPCS
jgi:hypothetical protein